MTIHFACGHALTIGDNQQTAPLCVICGESRIQSVQARAPRFVGVASGPLCEFKHLDPATVNLAPAGALKVNPPKE